MTVHWNPAPAAILATSPVVPVLVIDDPDHAVPIAEALMEGGIRSLEVTLRTPHALQVLETLARHCPDAITGAGTIANSTQLQQAVDAGAQFLISPGLTPTLLETAVAGNVPLIPGISTLSELMQGMEYGLHHFKFFPAQAAGGISMLKAIAGPFPDIRFCPTGGISPDNACDYLALPNVSCVGGSWLVTAQIIAEGNWQAITQLARQILDSVRA